MFGGGGDAGGDQVRVDPGLDPIGPLVGRCVPRAGDAQAVLDAHEIEQAAFGRRGEVGPVARTEQLAGAGIRGPPRGRMPAGAVQRGPEVQ
jgi:hypothetical protein